MLPNVDINSNYYITIAEGGWSPCIEGNDAHGLRPFAGSVLPNCVGFVTGRWNELLGLNDCIYLGNTDAKHLYNLAISQGCTAGKYPAEGALMVWNDTNNEGHAAVVETVYSRGLVIANESGWNYTSAPIVRGIVRQRDDGGHNMWGETSASRSFLGFVYLPGTAAPKYDDDAWYLYFHHFEGGFPQ